MEKFYFADLVVGMNCYHSLMQKRSRKYLLPENDDRKPDITVDVKVEEYERKRFRISDDINDDEFEYALAGESFYRRLLSFNGMMLHSSVVEYKGKAYLFSADSGVGKSTHTHLWTQYIPETRILNDDKPAIRFYDGEYKAYGTPFSGKHDESMNLGVPIGAIVFIERSKTNSIRKLSTAEILPLIYKQTTQPIASPKHMEILFGFLDGLLRKVPVYKLSCDISLDAVRTSFEALTGEKLDNVLKEKNNED
jgi:hypothetical protein